MEGGDVGWSKQEMIKGNAVEKEGLLHWEEHSILVCVGDLEKPRMGWVWLYDGATSLGCV